MSLNRGPPNQRAKDALGALDAPQKPHRTFQFPSKNKITLVAYPEISILASIRTVLLDILAYNLLSQMFQE